MANFSPICIWLLRQEDATLKGDIVNLGDGAGFTRFGITSKNFPNMPDGFFSTMPTEQAIQCAEDHYRAVDWARMHGDQITSDECAASLFSFCVNGGDTTEIEIVQRAFGLTADGNIGPMSLAALNAPGAGDKVRAAQAQHYTNLYNANPVANARWIHGWLNRANRVYPSLA